MSKLTQVLLGTLFFAASALAQTGSIDSGGGHNMIAKVEAEGFLQVTMICVDASGDQVFETTPLYTSDDFDSAGNDCCCPESSNYMITSTVHGNGDISHTVSGCEYFPCQ